MKQHFSMMATYNAWANHRLFEASAEIDDELYRRDEGAAFGSLHGTLNHMLVADRLWLHRFTGEGQTTTKLDEELYSDFAALHLARRDEDTRIIDFIYTLSDTQIGGMFSYTTVIDPERITQPMAPALAHFFNHQTHHRGQCHMLLTRLVGKAPSLDLIYFQRETGIGLR